jgi:hypothetical protein
MEVDPLPPTSGANQYGGLDAVKLKDPEEAVEEKMGPFPPTIWRPAGVSPGVENVPVTWAPTGKFSSGQEGKDLT